jgi:hypothetical protein
MTMPERLTVEHLPEDHQFVQDIKKQHEERPIKETAGTNPAELNLPLPDIKMNDGNVKAALLELVKWARAATQSGQGGGSRTGQFLRSVAYDNEFVQNLAFALQYRTGKNRNDATVYGASAEGVIEGADTSNAITYKPFLEQFDSAMDDLSRRVGVPIPDIAAPGFRQENSLLPKEEALPITRERDAERLSSPEQRQAGLQSLVKHISRQLPFAPLVKAIDQLAATVGEQPFVSPKLDVLAKMLVEQPSMAQEMALALEHNFENRVIRESAGYIPALGIDQKMLAQFTDALHEAREGFARAKGGQRLDEAQQLGAQLLIFPQAEVARRFGLTV